MSNVDVSAAGSVPVVAFAVPFETRAGRRVFSGALTVANTTIGASYLRSLYPYDATVYLIDGRAATIASSLVSPQTTTLLDENDADLKRALASGEHGSYPGSTGVARFAVVPVPGTPWRLVVAAPEAAILAPIADVSVWGPWLSFGGLAVLVFLVVVLALSLAGARGREVRAKEELISHAAGSRCRPTTLGAVPVTPPCWLPTITGPAKYWDGCRPTAWSRSSSRPGNGIRPIPTGRENDSVEKL